MPVQCGGTSGQRRDVRLAKRAEHDDRGVGYALSVTMQNTGSSTWTAASNHRLGSQNAQDNTTWGMNRVTLPNSVAPGASVTIGFTVTAPSTVTNYNFQWKMVNDGIGWFGAPSTNLSVPVQINDAIFVSQNVPTSMVAGVSYPVRLVFLNIGSTTWTAASNHRVGSQNAQDNTTWGMNRVPVPQAVAPGSTMTLDFTVTAPATAGTYAFQWKMVNDGISWFGGTSTNVNVTVSAATGWSSTMYFVEADHLNTPRRIENASNQAMWTWAPAEPFGDSAPNEQPTTGLAAFTFNPRFPGQYFDKESNLSYNYFREYDRSIGRYVQSDPVGIRGGANTYLYVGGSPLSYIDSFGLAPGDSYRSVPEAGRQAVTDINPTSITSNREYGGVIYQKPDGSYTYTEPRIGSEAGVSIPFGTSPPASGWYHTHGGDDPAYDGEKFSSADKGISDRRDIPGYLGTPRERIKEYTPRPGVPRGGRVRELSRKAVNACY